MHTERVPGYIYTSRGHARAKRYRAQHISQPAPSAYPDAQHQAPTDLQLACRDSSIRTVFYGFTALPGGTAIGLCSTRACMPSARIEQFSCCQGLRAELTYPLQKALQHSGRAREGSLPRLPRCLSAKPGLHCDQLSESAAENGVCCNIVRSLQMGHTAAVLQRRQSAIP